MHSTIQIYKPLPSYLPLLSCVHRLVMPFLASRHYHMRRKAPSLMLDVCIFVVMTAYGGPDLLLLSPNTISRILILPVKRLITTQLLKRLLRCLLRLLRGVYESISVLPQHVKSDTRCAGTDGARTLQLQCPRYFLSMPFANFGVGGRTKQVTYWDC